MRKLMIASGLALGLTALAWAPASAQDMSPTMADGEDVTMTAHVVDLSCKVVYNLQGEEMHRMCAQVCADAGIPLGLVDGEGNLFLPVSAGMPGSGDNERLKPHAEHEVTVTGKVIKRGGLNTIVIESIVM